MICIQFLSIVLQTINVYGVRMSRGLSARTHFNLSLLKIKQNHLPNKIKQKLKTPKSWDCAQLASSLPFHLPLVRWHYIYIFIYVDRKPPTNQCPLFFQTFFRRQRLWNIHVWGIVIKWKRKTTTTLENHVPFFQGSSDVEVDLYPGVKKQKRRSLVTF